MSVQASTNTSVFSGKFWKNITWWRVQALMYQSDCDIFHLNWLQIIIVFCPSAQTQINFPIKQLGLGIMFVLLMLLLPIKIHASILALFTLHRSFLVIKSYLFATLFSTRCVCVRALLVLAFWLSKDAGQTKYLYYIRNLFLVGSACRTLSITK